MRMAVLIGSNAFRSTTFTKTPPHGAPLCFGFVAAPGISLGTNSIGSKRTPGRLWEFNSPAHRSPLTYGAPIYSKGFSAPRPSERFVPSKKHVPGYTVALASVGIFGEGFIHINPVSSNQSVLFHPSILMTVRFALT